MKDWFDARTHALSKKTIPFVALEEAAEAMWGFLAPPVDKMQNRINYRDKRLKVCPNPNPKPHNPTPTHTTSDGLGGQYHQASTAGIHQARGGTHQASDGTRQASTEGIHQASGGTHQASTEGINQASADGTHQARTAGIHQVRNNNLALTQTLT
jgi:hypothetical protein